VLNKKFIAYIFFLIFIFEFTARSISYFYGYGFSTDNGRFISPFFTGNDIPHPILKDSTGIFVGDKEVLIKKNQNELRIIFVGGSTTKNRNNRKGLRFSNEVKKVLSSKYSELDIVSLNAGIESFSSAHSLINISLRIIEFEPDIIVIHHNANDRSVGVFGETITTDYSNKYLTDSYLGYTHRRGIRGFLVRHFKSLRILIWSSKTIKSFFIKTPYNTTGNKNILKGKNYFKRNLKSILSICKTHDIIPVFLTQPHKRLSIEKLHREYNDIIRNLSEENNSHIIDMAKLISKNKGNFIDQIHYSSDGIIEISNIIAPRLIDIIEVEKSNIKALSKK